MIAYKGFKKTADGKLMCRDMEYKPGNKYVFDGEIELCERGYHACHELHQVWYFYPNNGNNVFYEVECGGKIIESDNGSGKFVCSGIELIRPIDTSNVDVFLNSGEFKNGIALVNKKFCKYNFINTEGRFVSDIDFENVEIYGDDYLVYTGGKCNFMDMEGKFLFKKWISGAERFMEGFSAVKVDEGYNYFDRSGKSLSDIWFDYATGFSNGFGLVKHHGMWNFIKRDGTMLSKEWFEDAWCFCNGLAKVKINGKLTEINKDGKILDMY